MSAGPWGGPELPQHRPGEPTQPQSRQPAGSCLLPCPEITLLLTGETSPPPATKQNGCPVSAVLPCCPGGQTETAVAAVTCRLVRALCRDQDSPAGRSDTAHGLCPRQLCQPQASPVGPAGQGCGEMVTGPAAALFGPELMALGADMGLWL